MVFPRWFEDYLMCVTAEAEDIDNTSTFICCFSGKQGDLVGGDFKNINFIEVLLR